MFYLLQVHGNICMASTVVTPTLDWKLHALDVLSEFDGSSEASSGQMLVNLCVCLQNIVLFVLALLFEFTVSEIITLL